MSLKKVHKNLLKIKKTAGTNDKISLLTEMLKNSTFRRVITLMYDDKKHFKVNKMPEKTTLKNKNKVKNRKRLFKFLEKLASQRGASNSDKYELGKLASINEETYDVVSKIINKDAKCGFGGKTINKACPGLLFLMPYCRCSTAKNKMKNIKYKNGAFAQEKADGMFVNVIINKKGGVLFRSRNGNLVHQLDHLKKLLAKTPMKFRNTVYMGELLIKKDGIVFPRKTGNGILNSCIHNAEDNVDAKYAIIRLWDAVPYKHFLEGSCNIPYKSRFIRTKKLIKKLNNKDLIGQIRSKIVYSLDEAEKYYRKLRKDGKEGEIVKNLDAIWKDHTSPNQVKMKNISDAELRIVSWNYGKKGSKYENCCGSVNMESEDGLVKVSVSGMDDKERNMNWDELIGKIGGIEYEGIISDKNRKDSWSLYLPQWVELRIDKSYADTYKDLKYR